MGFFQVVKCDEKTVNSIGTLNAIIEECNPKTGKYNFLEADELAKVHFDERIQSGQENYYTYSSYLKESVIYIPKRITGTNGKIILSRKNLILEGVETESIMKAHKNGNLAQLPGGEEYADRVWHTARLINENYIIAGDESFNINYLDFGNHDVTKWLFGNIAAAYGGFNLARSGNKQMKFRFLNPNTIKNPAIDLISIAPGSLQGNMRHTYNELRFTLGIKEN